MYMRRKRDGRSYSGNCPKLRDLRQKLQDKIGNNFNSISSMLGRKSKEVINAVLDFAEASGRFRSRVPVRHD